MTPEQQAVINALRTAGYCVVIWTPYELGDCDSDILESVVIERGNDFIEWDKNNRE